MTTTNPSHSYSDQELVALLGRPRPLPRDPVGEQVVLWRTFRAVADAVRFSHDIMLGDGQHIIGGVTEDSLGRLYWIGVHVDDLAKWGNTRAIQMNDAFDPESPEIRGRPFER